MKGGADCIDEIPVQFDCRKRKEDKVGEVLEETHLK